MVSPSEASSRIIPTEEKFDDINRWIRKVRNKKIIKKRTSRGQDLRVLVMLSEALRQAEYQLRKKQEERAQRWAKYKSQLIDEKHLEVNEEEQAEKKRQIEDLWSSEFNGLNSFMKNLHTVQATS